MVASTFTHISRRPYKPAVIVPIMPNCLEEVTACVQHALNAGADLVEWRLDALGTNFLGADSYDKQTQLLRIIEVAKQLPRQRLICCWRGVRDEGGVPIADADYLQLLLALADHCMYLDIEYSFITDATTNARPVWELLRHKYCQLVCSAHFFSAMPCAAQMDEILRDMAKLGAGVAKVAVMPNGLADVVLFREVLDRVSKVVEIPIIGIAMGESGHELRLNGHEYGSAATFACIDFASAPGQLSLETVLDYFNEQ